MPKRNLVILAMLPIALLLIPGSPWEQRVKTAAVIAGTYLVMYLLTRWVRWHDARGAARYVARQSGPSGDSPAGR